MAHSILELNGSWRFKEYPVSARRMRDLDEGDWFECTCPNSIFINLAEAGLINKKELLANPENYAWVSDKPWVFRRHFDVSKQMLESDKVEVVFDGLDTIASVWLNEKLLGKTDNMFIPHRFDITEYVKPQDNILTVKFEPVVPYAQNLMERYTPFSEKDFAHPYRAYVRKAQYQFGWDFCPSLPGCGIWRDANLEGIKGACIRNYHIRTINCTEKSADIKIAVEIDMVTSKKNHCRVKISDPDDNNTHSLEFEPHKGSGSVVFHVENPKLWWPNGYGRQSLYRIEIDLLADSLLLDRKSGSFGIRTVNLNQSHERGGNKFQFEINSQPIYAKGANWIPASIFAGSVTEDDYRILLAAAADANINMLRVWGGGYYENEVFYRLCDELGIMVWQDFMFACAYYPDRQWFIKKIADETKSVVSRLYNHPSVVLYCGNNEIHWQFQNQKKGRGHKFHGKVIFDKLLPKLLGELDPDRPYIPTTPFSVKGQPDDPDSGTIHNWDVWSGHKPIRHYITSPESVPRFVTEFGTQSLPSVETLSDICPVEKLNVGSFAVEKHNYQTDGNSRLYRYCGDLFGATSDFKKFVFLTQLAQARAAKMYVEYLRACNYRNSGVLFWQFDDACPAVSWSALDYQKTPKALYYYAKRFFAPVLITVIAQYKEQTNCVLPELDWLGVVVVNDSCEPVTGTINCQLIDFYGNKIDGVQLPAAVGPFSVSRPVKLPKALTFPAEPEKVALYAVFETNKGNAVSNLFFYLPDKYIPFPKANINQQLSCVGEKRAVLTLTSEVLTRDVFIESRHHAEPGDNYINLLPNTPKQIGLKLESSVNEVQHKIKVFSLFF
ncbi:MAG: glycoside hydrolase family 2 protein [Sedimentisphaerales bacterium]|nr:glycoside hydrolase family 2 protein [Sedimentisphaerales bacterium]